MIIHFVIATNEQKQLQMISPQSRTPIRVQAYNIGVAVINAPYAVLFDQSLTGVLYYRDL